MRGSLAGEFGLKLKPDFNGDGHQQPLSGLSLPYPAGFSASSGWPKQTGADVSTGHHVRKEMHRIGQSFRGRLEPPHPFSHG
jgi:hypothetical protein